VFCRNSDDCTTAYATRKGFNGSVSNIRMTNSTLWADVAHPILVGVHGNTEQPDSIVGVKYDNIDIICQSEPQVNCQGCMAIVCGDNNMVRDVTFENIRIEQIHQGSILHMSIVWGEKYNTAPGRGIENVTFRNIRYNGKLANMSVINGYNEQRKIKNVRFENFKVNGKLIYDDMPGKLKWYQTADYVPIYIGSHVENVKFVKQ